MDLQQLSVSRKAMEEFREQSLKIKIFEPNICAFN